MRGFFVIRKKNEKKNYHNYRCFFNFAGIGASGTTPGCIVGTLGLHFIFGVKFPSW